MVYRREEKRSYVCHPYNNEPSLRAMDMPNSQPIILFLDMYVVLVALQHKRVRPKLVDLPKLYLHWVCKQYDLMYLALNASYRDMYRSKYTLISTANTSEMVHVCLRNLVWRNATIEWLEWWYTIVKPSRSTHAKTRSPMQVSSIKDHGLNHARSHMLWNCNIIKLT